MGNPLRDRRTPSELAESGQVIEFDEKIGDFARLAAIVQADLAALDPATLPADWREQPVSGRLEFRFADAHKRLAVLDGAVAVTLVSVCQRCLAPFHWSLDVPLRLLFAVNAGGGAAAVSAADDYELWELDEETLRPLDVIDESLVMALPLVAMHVNDTSCPAPGATVAESADEKLRPFASLRSRMEKDH